MRRMEDLEDVRRDLLQALRETDLIAVSGDPAELDSMLDRVSMLLLRSTDKLHKIRLAFRRVSERQTRRRPRPLQPLEWESATDTVRERA